MIQRLLLAIIVLDIPFQIDTHFGYRSDLADLHVYSGYCASLTTIALVALYAMWLPKLALRICVPPRLLFRMSLPLAAYVACVALSLIWAYHVSVSLFEVFLLLQMFLMFVYVVGAVRTQEDVQFLVTMLIVSLLLESIVMIVGQFGIQIPGFATRVSEETQHVYRSGGTVGSPNVAASYLCLCLMVALGMLFAPVGRGYRWLAATAFGLGTIALVVTLSRGGWVAFMFNIPVFFFFVWRRGAIRLRQIMVLGAVIVLVGITVSGAVYGRLFENEGESAGARMPLMQMARLVIQDHPVLGIGANNYPIVVWRYVRPNFSGEYISAVHNKYLLIWAETGILSLVAFLWFLTATMLRGWRCWQRSDPVLAFPALALTVAIAGQMLHMGVARFTGRPQIQLLWLVAAIIAAIVCLNSEGQEAATTHSRPLSWHRPYALT